MLRPLPEIRFHAEIEAIEDAVPLMAFAVVKIECLFPEKLYGKLKGRGFYSIWKQ
jgi:hypothetical protein